MAALDHLARWPRPVKRIDATVCSERRQRWAARLPAGVQPFELLADYGVPVVDVRHANSIDAAVAAAGAVGYPVALKTVAALHKSDVGGVVLDIADAAGLTAAYTAMAYALGPDVTVEPMVEAGVEVSVGIVRDEAFGPLLVVAAGGTLVELLADRVVVCPPVSRTGALALLDRMRIRPLLAGWRGGPAADVDGLADVIAAFSQIAVELGDVLDAVEANPVIASAHGVVAVDVLVQVQNPKRGVGLFD